MTKFTKASLKKFIKDNADRLEIKQESKFNGMSDMVEVVEETYKQAQPAGVECKENMGINGLWVTRTGNLFNTYEVNGYKYVNVWNCCGETTLRAEA